MSGSEVKVVQQGQMLGNAVGLTSSEVRNGQRSNNLKTIIRALGVCDPWLVRSVCFLVWFGVGHWASQKFGKRVPPPRIWIDAPDQWLC